MLSNNQLFLSKRNEHIKVKDKNELHNLAYFQENNNFSNPKYPKGNLLKYHAVACHT